MRQLKIRNLIPDDLKKLEELHSTNCDFPLPDLLNHLYCCNKVVEDDAGNTIGIGIVRLTSESILIIDKKCTKLLRVRVVKMMIDQMKSEVKSLGMDETHCWISNADSLLRQMLIKTFGFLACKSKSVYLQF